MPITLLPQWMQDAATWFPFEWTFGFPIDAVVTPQSPSVLLTGLGVQALWVGIGSLLLAVVWRRAVRRYTGVGA